MDPRHVLPALVVLVAVSCASTGQTVSPATTTTVVDTSSAPVSETGQSSESGVEQSESSTSSPGTTAVKLDTGASSESPATTTSSFQEIETDQSSDSSVEQSEGDSSESESTAVQIAAASEFDVAGLARRLEVLTVQPERRSGYDRGLFDHWVDADGDGCDTRREVLLAEAVVGPRVGASCVLFDGEWVGVYDGVRETGSGSGFDVDHLVPLAEAWDSGAYAWDSDTRRRYANDLGYEHSLVAVSSSSNRQKGAADPAEWLPPEVSVRCWYAEAWIAVKTRWGLSVDEGESSALRSLVSQCDGLQLAGQPVTTAPILAPVTTAPILAPVTTAPILAPVTTVPILAPVTTAPILAPVTTAPISAPVTTVPILAPVTTAPILAPVTTAVEADGDGLCHPDYIPCLPNLPGDAVNCGDLSGSQKPVEVRSIGVDPYRLDRDRDGQACES